MLKIIHVSDTHIAPVGQLVVGLDPQRRFRQVVHAINRDHSDAALCVITGDLTDGGEEEAYRALAEILGELKVPYRLMMGNHDNRANFLRIFPDAPVDQNGFIQSSVDLEDVRLIFLDTLDDDHAGQGRLCGSRLEWLDVTLRHTAATGRRSVIFMHHPPFSVGVRVFDDMLLANPQPFLARIANTQSILHLGFGHLHLTTSGSWRGLPYSCNRGVAHRIALSLDAAVTAYVEAKPTFDVMLISEDGVFVHHTAPVVESDIIAKEYPTDDGVGRLEMLRHVTGESGG